MKVTTKGKCLLCGKVYEAGGMSRHISSCLSKTELSKGVPARMEKIYEIHITDRDNKNYWLFVEMSGGEILASLDQFLRDIWCGCGHLSGFRINGSFYSSNPSTDFWSMDEEEGMDVSIDTVLNEGMKFSYIYDFGSSTELALTVKSVRMGKELEEGIRLIAQNDMPEFKCSVCKKRKAKYINPMAYYEDDVVFLCNKCCDLLEEDELDVDVDPDDLLSICNSPRMGACGYCGESDDWD